MRTVCLGIRLLIFFRTKSRLFSFKDPGGAVGPKKCYRKPPMFRFWWVLHILLSWFTLSERNSIQPTDIVALWTKQCVSIRPRLWRSCCFFWAALWRVHDSARFSLFLSRSLTRLCPQPRPSSLLWKWAIMSRPSHFAASFSGSGHLMNNTWLFYNHLALCYVLHQWD